MSEHQQKQVFSFRRYFNYLTTIKSIYGIELLIFIFWLCAYGLTTSHSVVEGDTGEFLASAAVHGVPHDPGFPLYSIITRLVYLLPFEHSAWAINITSAIFASFALVITYRLVKLITNNINAAIFSVLTLGTYEYFWFYASVTQVHTLQVLLLVLYTYFLVLLVKTKAIKYLYSCALIIGLGIAHSYTIFLVVPSLLIVLYSLKRNLSFMILLKTFIYSCFGLLTYIYIIWVSSTNPPINWGRIHDINSFLFIFFRGDYGFLNLGPENAANTITYSSFIYYFQSLFITSWYILPFALLSLWYLYKKNFIYTLLFCCFLFLGPFFYLLMDQSVISVTYKANVEQYLSYSFLYVSIFAGIGVNMLVTKYSEIRSRQLVMLFICFIFFLIPFFTTFNDMQLETDGLVASTIKLILSEMPKNSVLITTGDDFYFPALYWQYFKNYRRDITIIDLNTSAPWYMENLQIRHPELSFLFLNPKDFYRNACNDIATKGRLFIYPWVTGFDSVFTNNCKVIPYGLIEKVTPVKTAPSADQIKSFNDSVWNTYAQQVSLEKYKTTSSRTREFLLSLADQLTYQGFYYQQIGENNWALDAYRNADEVSPDEVTSLMSESLLYYKENDIGIAISLLNEGVNRNPAIAILYKNLGIFYLKENNRSGAYQNFEQYLYFNSDDKDVPAIKNFVNSYNINGE